MASLRKRPEETPEDTQVSAPAEQPKPAEPSVENPADIAKESLVADAEENALNKRIKEMERAEAAQAEHFNLIREHEEQRPKEQPQSQEEPTPEQLLEQMPPRVQRFYKAHPEMLSDPELVAHAGYLHHKIGRELGVVFSDEYFDKMEQALFNSAAQATSAASGNGSEQDKPKPKPALQPESPSKPQRSEQRPAQQPQSSANFAVAAPPSREGLSISGRPVSDKLKPTAADYEGAEIAGIDIDTYMEEKKRALRTGAIGTGK